MIKINPRLVQAFVVGSMAITGTAQAKGPTNLLIQTHHAVDDVMAGGKLACLKHCCVGRVI